MHARRSILRVLTALLLLCAASRLSSALKVAAGKVKGGGRATAKIIVIDDIHSDAYKLQEVCKMLAAGCCGVIPTDTCYSFVAAVDSRAGVDKLLKCKQSGKKPLSFLCKDLSMISKYTGEASRDKWVFKMLKTLLPGPFTFVLPTNPDTVPKFVMGRKHPGHRTRKWKRTEIGVRIPDDDVSLQIMKELQVPLLTGSIPEAGEDYVDVSLRSLAALSSSSQDDSEDGEEENYADDDRDDASDEEEEDGAFDYHNTAYHQDVHEAGFPWSNLVDFIVVAGPRGGGTAEQLSTIVDLTSGAPVVIRQGKGQLGEFASRTVL